VDPGCPVPECKGRRLCPQPAPDGHASMVRSLISPAAAYAASTRLVVVYGGEAPLGIWWCSGPSGDHPGGFPAIPAIGHPGICRENGALPLVASSALGPSGPERGAMPPRRGSSLREPDPHPAQRMPTVNRPAPILIANKVVSMAQHQPLDQASEPGCCPRRDLLDQFGNGGVDRTGNPRWRRPSSLWWKAL